MKEKRFQKRIESFVCEYCGEAVEGNGYTDHCPKCLWSKHVDINPGDRKSNCAGMMEPVDMEIKGNGYIIYYKCEKCNLAHRVKSGKDDDVNKIVKLSFEKNIYEKNLS